MNSEAGQYHTYSKDQVSKIGNTIIYLARKIKSPAKTTILKLLYILDEKSIEKSGLPFLNLEYKVWKFGPVSQDIFVELSDKPTFLKGYFTRDETTIEGNIIPEKEFCDDEFSQNDLDLLDSVIAEFGNKTSKYLVEYTHKEGSLWHIAAKKHDVLDLLQNEKINTTDFKIDFSELLLHDKKKKGIYEEFLEHN